LTDVLLKQYSPPRLLTTVRNFGLTRTNNAIESDQGQYGKVILFCKKNMEKSEKSILDNINLAIFCRFGNIRHIWMFWLHGGLISPKRTKKGAIYFFLKIV